MSVYSVAVDGPSGAGKSTLSKAVAQELGIVYVDTGAIYRSLDTIFLRWASTRRTQVPWWALCP